MAAMIITRWDGVLREQLNDKAARQVLHFPALTLARLYLQTGAVVPRHSHPQEQITQVEQGHLRFVFDQETIEVRTGELLHIPGGLFHRVEAVEDTVALDTFTPARDDWQRGEDQYLRQGR